MTVLLDQDGWDSGILVGGTGGDRGALVVRFGGSLLERADWPELAESLLRPFPGSGPGTSRTLVVGGGGVVEGLRAIDRRRRVDQRLAHRLAIDGMGITARLVATTLGLPLVTSPGVGEAVLDMAGWLAADRKRADAIPATWEVTSDSLAAVVAAAHACDLLLAKSVPPPRPPTADHAASLAELSALGWVDGWFPRAAGGVARIGWAAPAR